MAMKELSQYPPDKWIRAMNRKYPNIWTDLRKVYEDPGKMIRPNSGGIELLQSVPDWCIMPTFFPFLVMTDKYGELFYMTHMDELMTLGSTYIWRCSKGIYRFAPEIYQALISQPLTGDLPMECLHHLPEWAVYVETPGLSYERHPMEGFIAHLDYNLFSRSTDLQFAMFLKGREEPRMVALPFGDGSLLDAMERVDQLDNMFTDDIHRVRYVGTRDEYKATFTSMLQLLFYLCSDEPDMPEIEHPQKRRTLSGGVRAPGEPRVWDVGVRISNVIRKYRNGSAGYQRDENAEPGTHASPRPHVRSAHWHTYWTGPRQAQFPERKPIVKWIPPIPIGMDWKRELPTTIRTIAE